MSMLSAVGGGGLRRKRMNCGKNANPCDPVRPCLVRSEPAQQCPATVGHGAHKTALKPPDGCE